MTKGQVNDYILFLSLLLLRGDLNKNDSTLS